jgi:hypothetical protein
VLLLQHLELILHLPLQPRRLDLLNIFPPLLRLLEPLRQLLHPNLTIVRRVLHLLELALKLSHLLRTRVPLLHHLILARLQIARARSQVNRALLLPLVLGAKVHFSLGLALVSLA